MRPHRKIHLQICPPACAAHRHVNHLGTAPEDDHPSSTNAASTNHRHRSRTESHNGPSAPPTPLSTRTSSQKRMIWIGGARQPPNPLPQIRSLRRAHVREHTAASQASPAHDASAPASQPLLEASGHTMYSALQQLYPPFPVFHTGVVGSNVAGEEHQDEAAIRVVDHTTAPRCAAPITSTVGQRTIAWPRFSPLASFTAPSHDGVSTEQRVSSFNAGNNAGFGGPVTPWAAHYPPLLARQLLLPFALSPAVAPPLRALAAAIAGTSSSPTLHTRTSADGHVLVTCPLTRWLEAPSFYGTPVAPFHVSGAAIHRLWHLTLRRERQQVPSLVVLEERAREADAPRDRTAPDSARTAQTAQDVLVDTITTVARGNMKQLPAVADHLADAGFFPQRSLDVSPAPVRGVEPVLWRLQTSVATVELPVTVCVDRFLLPGLLPPSTEEGDVPESTRATEAQTGARRVTVSSPLVTALRHSQREFLRRGRQEVKGPADACVSALQAPWVWCGDAWYQELDPQLSDAAAAAATTSPHSRTSEKLTRAQRAALDLPIPAWVPVHWSTGLPHRGSPAPLHYASPDTYPLTVLLHKTWTVGGAGALAAQLAETSLSTTSSASICQTGANPLATTTLSEAIKDRKESFCKDTMQTEGTTWTRATPSVVSPPKDDAVAEKLLEHLRLTGRQNASTLFPNYDAHSGLPFTVSNTPREETSCNDGSSPQRQQSPSSGPDAEHKARLIHENKALMAINEQQHDTILPEGGEGENGGTAGSTPRPLKTTAQTTGTRGARRLGKPPKKRPWQQVAQRLTRPFPALRRDETSVGLFELAYAAQTVCWLKASCGEFQRTAASSQARLSLVSRRWNPLLCDAKVAGRNPHEHVTGTHAAAATASTGEEGSGGRNGSAVARLKQEVFLTCVLLTDLPSWFVKAFDTISAAYDYLSRHVPPLCVKGLVTHGEEASCSPNEGFVYVLQLRTGPADGPEGWSPGSSHSHVAAERNGHLPLVWHRYDASDTTVNFLYRLHDVVEEFNTKDGACQFVASLCRGGDITLTSQDALFLDIRAALLLLSVTPEHPVPSPIATKTKEGGRRNLMSLYEDQAPSFPSHRGTNFTLHHGAASRFMDFLVRHAGKDVAWSFEALGKAMARQLPDPNRHASDHPLVAREETAEGEGQRQGDETQEEEVLEKRVTPPPTPPPDAFLHALDVRRVDADGRVIPATQTDSVCSSEALPSAWPDDFPAVDRRALPPGHRLYEGFTSRDEVARLTRVEAVALGKARTLAIRAANQRTRLERQLFSANAQASRSGRSSACGKRAATGESDDDTVSRLDAHLVERHPALLASTAPTLTSSSDNGATLGGEGKPNVRVEAQRWRLEAVLRQERDRTAERWAPWMRLINPRPLPPSSRDQCQRKGRRRMTTPDEDPLPSLMDNERNTQDAAMALRAVVSSPLQECCGMQRGEDGGGEDATLPQGGSPCVWVEDLGVIVLCVRYAEPYVNAVNTAFASEGTTQGRARSP